MQALVIRPEGGAGRAEAALLRQRLPHAACVSAGHGVPHDAHHAALPHDPDTGLPAGRDHQVGPGDAGAVQHRLALSQGCLAGAEEQEVGALQSSGFTLCICYPRTLHTANTSMLYDSCTMVCRWLHAKCKPCCSDACMHQIPQWQAIAEHGCYGALSFGSTRLEAVQPWSQA